MKLPRKNQHDPPSVLIVLTWQTDRDGHRATASRVARIVICLHSTVFTAVDPADFNTVISVVQFVGGRLQLEDEVVRAGCVTDVERQWRTGARCVVMHVVASTQHIRHSNRAYMQPILKCSVLFCKCIDWSEKAREQSATEIHHAVKAEE